MPGEIQTVLPFRSRGGTHDRCSGCSSSHFPSERETQKHARKPAIRENQGPASGSERSGPEHDPVRRSRGAVACSHLHTECSRGAPMGALSSLIQSLGPQRPERHMPACVPSHQMPVTLGISYRVFADCRSCARIWFMYSALSSLNPNSSPYTWRHFLSSAFPFSSSLCIGRGKGMHLVHPCDLVCQ